MIDRLLYKNMQDAIHKGKAVIILGARQVGKTTLLNQFQREYTQKILLLDGDEPDIRSRLTNPTSTALKQLIGEYKMVLIDEAQRIENIGITLKLITDKLPDVQLIVTGSSSLDLANQINEPLTGRKFEYLMFPMSIKEMLDYHGIIEEKRSLETRLIFGMYPDIITHPGNEKELLKQLTNSYLFKDILTYKEVRKPEMVERLLVALALQVSSEVAYHEIGQTIGVDPVTVEKYIQILEKSFVVFRLSSYSRNLRNELKKSRKIYFYDNGIRNAIISNFSPMALRDDIGKLWENFLMSERQKQNHYRTYYANIYFWRTAQQQEIDYIEEHDGQLSAFEFKWNPKKKHFPATFLKAYPKATASVIHPNNYLEWLNITGLQDVENL